MGRGPALKQRKRRNTLLSIPKKKILVICGEKEGDRGIEACTQDQGGRSDRGEKVSTEEKKEPATASEGFFAELDAVGKSRMGRKSDKLE